MSAGSHPGVGTRLQDWFLHLPLATRSITALCCGIYIVGLIFGQNDFSVCIFPPNVIEQFQVYRLLTAGFFHVGFLHVVMNMLAFQALAPSLERAMGSFTFSYLVVLFQVVSSLMNTFLSLVLYKTGAYPDAWNQCTIGLSSVLFSFLVLRSHLHQSHNMSLFGFVSVPAQWYPWVLLVLFQFLMPEVSFLGHLTGILVAYLHVWGKLELFKLPSETINKIESSSYLQWLVMKDGYITNTQFGVGGGEETLPTHQAAAASSSSGVGAGFAGFLTSMRGMVGGGDSASSSSSATSTQTQGAPTTNTNTNTSSAGFVPFSGQGHTLRAG